MKGMVGEIKRYFKIYRIYFKQSLMLLMSHRFNLLMSVVANVVWTFGQIVSLRFLFIRIPEIEGWNFNDLVLLLVFGQCALYLSYIIFEGNLLKLGDKIIAGDLDNKLTKPIAIKFQLSFESVMVAQIIPMFVTVIPLFIFGFWGTSVAYFNLIWAFLVLILGIIIKYYFTLFLSGTFFFVERIELLRFIPELREFNRVPPSLFPKWIKQVFTFIIPVLLVSYFPLLVAKGGLGVINVLFMEICILTVMMLISQFVWKKGMRRYSGIG